MNSAEIFILVFLTSFLVCALIRVSRGWHISAVIRRQDTLAIQAAHSVPTPRLGGVAFLAGLLSCLLWVPDTVAPQIQLGLISVLPVFLAGLAEDLGLPVSPLGRMLAAGLSSVLIIWSLGVWLPRFGLPYIDALMMWTPLAIAVTIFCSAGITNAFNLIDGINGLSGFTGLFVGLALATIAFETGLVVQAHLALLTVAALMGFLPFNYPWGKVFLGDAGAYAVGFILCWLAISMVFAEDTLAPWAIFLIFFWPIADTLLAIYRRGRSGRPTGRPDRLHFHQLVMRALEINLMGRNTRAYSNPLATLILMPLVAAPVVTGVLLWDAPQAAFLASSLFAGLFIGTYRLGLAMARRRRTKAVAQWLQGKVGVNSSLTQRVDNRFSGASR